MFLSRGLSRSRAGSVLLASGLTMTGLAVLADCGSSGPSSTATSSARPSWASALGSGVTVTAPRSVAPGHGSPGAATAGELAALDAKNIPAACGYFDPATATQCKSQASQVLTSELPYVTNVAIGYVAIDGDKALVGMTGKYCIPGHSPECYANTDPAAVLSSGESFSRQWSAALISTTSNLYSLTPCIEVDGKWYVYLPSS